MYNVFCDLCAEQTASGAVSAVSDTLATPIKLNHWKGGKPVERQHVNDNLYNHWYFQLHFFFYCRPNSSVSSNCGVTFYSNLRRLVSWTVMHHRQLPVLLQSDCSGDRVAFNIV